MKILDWISEFGDPIWVSRCDATSTAVLVAILNLTESATLRGRDREGPLSKTNPDLHFHSPNSPRESFMHRTE